MGKDDIKHCSECKYYWCEPKSMQMYCYKLAKRITARKKFCKHYELINDSSMKTLMIDIMLNDLFYATFRYKYCPSFKFDIEDMTNKIYERYPTLRKRAMNGEKVVFAF